MTTLTNALRVMLHELNNSFDAINSGGCGIVAAAVYRTLKRHGYHAELISECGSGYDDDDIYSSWYNHVGVLVGDVVLDTKGAHLRDNWCEVFPCETVFMEVLTKRRWNPTFEQFNPEFYSPRHALYRHAVRATKQAINIAGASARLT